MSESANDPEVQRNGIELYGDRFNLPDGVLDTFFSKHFDPSDPFERNNRRFWEWFTGAIPDCPVCGNAAKGAEVVDNDPIRVAIKPCGHTVDDDEIDVDADLDAL